MFAVTKQNSPLGKVMWYDGEFYHSHTVNNETYPLFVQVGPEAPAWSPSGPLTLQEPVYT